MEGDGGEAVNLEMSGMPLLSEHASSSSYERPLKEDGTVTTTPRTISHLSAVSRYQFESAVFIIGLRKISSASLPEELSCPLSDNPRSLRAFSFSCVLWFQMISYYL